MLVAWEIRGDEALKEEWREGEKVREERRKKVRSRRLMEGRKEEKVANVRKKRRKERKSERCGCR